MIPAEKKTRTFFVETDDNFIAYIDEDVTLNPFESTIIYFNNPQLGINDFNKYFQPLSNFYIADNVLLANCLIKNELFTTGINLTDTPIKLQKGMKLGKIGIINKKKIEKTFLCKENMSLLKNEDFFSKK